ncbi:sugar ABC transporter ATP-binding protein (plasmid) [Rhizobium lusitanum]|uniref:sugar ABC transporter ATP-binding protein n=1 Tax=Rhizobium lusitanum TaxID=293958 RepID=UPI001617D94C|nr:sugar ABC transporter ATP-binding protein [Rhizobium lusitanum]QND44414.1 sugar ABC transporter ATP-binding protein [Rhizobium lusitanum]
MLIATGISKQYGGVFALDNVGFELVAGEIHGLCGENGAGKSTLVKILGGLVEPSSGELTIDGHGVVLGRRIDPSLITIVHQELSILPHLSVLDNIVIGMQDKSMLYLRKRYVARVKHHLSAVGLDHVDPWSRAGGLSLAERQLVEIARGLASGAKVLLLDEPTATLSDAEIEKVFAVMRKLKDGGTTMVIISHRLDEIFAITDRVTVFRSGRHIFTRDTAALTGPELVRAMLGHDVERGVERPVRATGKCRLALEKAEVAGAYEPCDLTFAEGEIVAIVGQLGSGADVILKSLAGLAPLTTGALRIDGRLEELYSIRDAASQAIAYVPEDRAAKGVFLDAPIGVNLTSHSLADLSRGGVISRRRDRKRTRELAEALTIDPRRTLENVSVLSGGNQQKVALGKAIAPAPDVLLLNEPTRGVDIGARADIYDRLRRRADAGLSIIFYSTDLEEVLEFADRVITVFRGKIIRDASRVGLTSESILHDILHGPEKEAA